MAVQIIDTLKPMNDGAFPVAMANDIELSTGERLEDYLKNNPNQISTLAADIAKPVNAVTVDKKKDIIKTSPVFLQLKRKLTKILIVKLIFILTVLRM